jgi:hypothetical protein
MIPFITYREPDMNDVLQYYILQKRHPHFIGVLWGLPEFNLVPSVGVSGHTLWIKYAGTLSGLFPAQRDIDKELAIVLQDMALWFYQHRILNDEKKYKKFKIKKDVPASNQ